MTASRAEDLLGQAHLVRVMWSQTPEPCFRIVFLEKMMREQWADTGEWTADTLRVKARELVARGLKVQMVNCPANVAVYYDQSAVERLIESRSADRPEPLLPDSVSDDPEATP